jgi:hypothetical protein
MAAAEKEKKPIMSCSSSGHITKLKQSIFAPFNIYGTEHTFSKSPLLNAVPEFGGKIQTINKMSCHRFLRWL